MAKVIQKIKIGLCNLAHYVREHGGYGILGVLATAMVYFFVKTA